MSPRTYTENEIQDLTDRVFLVKEKIEAGKLCFAEHLADDFRRSYAAIRLRPDGLVDPATVDGRIRASALAIHAIKYREKAKQQVSLAQIQEAYFNILYEVFGPLYEQMNKAGATPTDAARSAERDSQYVKSIKFAFPGLVAHLNEFWQTVGDAAAYHLRDGQQLKATYAGDLFPAHWANAVSTVGLYVDTIILPCPIVRMAHLVNIMPSRKFVAALTKHILTAISYRKLATADLDPPIVLVLPNEDDILAENRQWLVERAEPAVRKHAEHLFGRPFESTEHLKLFCDSLASVDQVLRELKGFDRLLFDTAWDRNPRAQLQRAMSERSPIIPGLDTTNAGHHVFGACVGRMPQAMATQNNAIHFGGTPLISAETSWLHYTWLLDYEAAPTPNGERHGQSMHVVRALVSEGQSNLEWLGNVPPETILEIRKLGLAEEIRTLLGRGITDLIGVNPNNYFRTTDQVIENLDHAFNEHQRALREAKLKKLKLYGIDVGSCIAVGGISVAAALTGNPMLGAISGLLGIAGLPNLKDIKTSFSAIAAEDRIRRSSPTGLLFRHLG